MKAYRELVEAAKGVEATYHTSKPMWLEMRKLRDGIRTSESELARMENAISSEGVFYGNEDEAIKLTALFSTRMLKGKRVKIIVMEVE